MNLTGSMVGARTARKAGWIVAFTALFLGALIFTGGTPASAARNDCVFASCGFGVVAPVLGNPIPPQTLTVPLDYSATLNETVYVNGNTYTYLFTTHNKSTAEGGVNAVNPLGTLSTSTLPSPIVGLSITSFMDGSLNFGIVETGGPAGDSSGAGGLDYAGANTSFAFNPSSFQASNFHKAGSASATGIVLGDTLAWYGQAKLGPFPGITTYVDGSLSSSGLSLDPAPEPSTALLLGLGFPMLSGLVARAKRWRGRTKVSAAIPA